MKIYQSIDIILENCDHINIPIKYIENLFLHVKGTTIRHCNEDEISEDIFLDYAKIIIKDLDKYEYIGEFKDAPTNALKRLQIPDITWIKINYNEEKSKSYVVPWGSNSLYINTYQKIYKDKQHQHVSNNLWIIEIKKRWNVKTLIENIKTKWYEFKMRHLLFFH